MTLPRGLGRVLPWLLLPLAAGDLDRLNESLPDANVFGRSWRELADPPIGGDTTGLRVTAGGREYHVPAHPADPRQAEQIAGIYRMIRQLVPREAWSRLNAQRAEFEAQNGAE